MAFQDFDVSDERGGGRKLPINAPYSTIAGLVVIVGAFASFFSGGLYSPIALTLIMIGLGALLVSLAFEGLFSPTTARWAAALGAVLAIIIMFGGPEGPTFVTIALGVFVIACAGVTFRMAPSS